MIRNPGVEHQVAHKNVKRCHNTCKDIPANRHLNLCILPKDSQDAPKRILADMKQLCSRILGDHLP